MSSAATGRAADNVLFMGFNQDASCVSIGTRSGYRIFNCQPFGRNDFSTDGGIGVVEMLFCTSLVALVGAGDRAAFSPCHLKLWNTKTASVICELDFATEIQAVRMNRKRLIVVLEHSLHIYDLDTMVNLQTLEVTTMGTRWGGGGGGGGASCASSLLSSPLCELSPDENNALLALPATGVSGDVFLYDTLNLVEFEWIAAHKAALTALRFSLDGAMLATASETGTVIRVFRVPSGERLYSFRRGTYSATVYSLAFDETATMLAASSSNGTVHVFRVGERHGRDAPPLGAPASTGPGAAEGGGAGIGTSAGGGSGEADGSSASAGGFLGKAATNAISFLDKRRELAGRLLPGMISDMVEPARSFAIARLKSSNVVSRCALAKGLLSVVTSEGHFFQFAVGKDGCELAFEMSLQAGDAKTDGFTRFFEYAPAPPVPPAPPSGNDQGSEGAFAAWPDMEQSAGGASGNAGDLATQSSADSSAAQLT